MGRTIIETPEERFNRKYTVDPISGCWLWTAGISIYGYAKFTVKKKTIHGHRWAYQHFIGPVSKGLVLDHLCRVRRCVNPDHMEVVTHRENILRGHGPAAQNNKKTHCKRGHPFSGENLVIRKDGYRGCRVCFRMLERRHAQRHKKEARQSED